MDRFVNTFAAPSVTVEPIGGEVQFTHIHGCGLSPEGIKNLQSLVAMMRTGKAVTIEEAASAFQKTHQNISILVQRAFSAGFLESYGVTPTSVRHHRSVFRALAATQIPAHYNFRFTSHHRQLTKNCAAAGTSADLAGTVSSHPTTLNSHISAISHRMGFISPTGTSRFANNSQRFLLACVAFIEGQVEHIHIDAYPQIRHLERPIVEALVEAACQTTPQQIKDICERREVSATRGSFNVTKMSQVLGLNFLPDETGHLNGFKWPTLALFLRNRKPSALSVNQYAREVFQYLSTKDVFAANRNRLRKIAQYSSAPLSGRLRFLHLGLPPFTGNRREKHLCRLAKVQASLQSPAELKIAS